MSTKTRGKSVPSDDSSSASSESEHEGSSTPRPKSEKKTKRFVKKKGETRKRDSADNLTLRVPQIDKISKRFKKMRIKTEALGTNENNNDETKATTSKIENSEAKKQAESKNGKEREKTPDAEGTEAEGVGGGSNIEEKCENPEKQTQDQPQGLKQIPGRVKTEEQRKRDRETARFAKAVARFSDKFSKAAKDLGIIERDSNSDYDSSSSSSSTDSCSSSCTCSDCCTSDSRSCTCSECCSENSSECSSTDSSSSSSSTPNE